VRFPTLTPYGWTPERDEVFPVTPPDPTDTDLTPARVIKHDRVGWTVMCVHGELRADLRGAMRGSTDLTERPGVGDWVAISPRLYESSSTIESVLPRTSALVRNAAGRRTEAQVLAANVDTVLICVPADAAANPRRVERELAMVWESGAEPVVVLTKSDLETDRAWIELVSMGAAVVSVDSVAPDGVVSLDPWRIPGRTLVVIGPSGAGKSTLANRLLAEDRLATGAVRDADWRGKHTTTWRELVVLPCGTLLIDTPGIRELSLWDAAEGVAAVFDDVEEVAAECRFSNCSHQNEPGCAIIAALADGSLAQERIDSWRKLDSELAFQARRVDAQLASAEKKKWATLTKTARERRKREQ
jgi:ribosome biogenesis GTPase / thiamine phosphate phosphatase